MSKKIIREFVPIENGSFKGHVGTFNPHTSSWYIATAENTKGATVITHIVKKDNSIITLGTKETRYAKKAQPAPDFPKEV